MKRMPNLVELNSAQISAWVEADATKPAFSASETFIPIDPASSALSFDSACKTSYQVSAQPKTGNTSM